MMIGLSANLFYRINLQGFSRGGRDTAGIARPGRGTSRDGALGGLINECAKRDRFAQRAVSCNVLDGGGGLRDAEALASIHAQPLEIPPRAGVR
jgi:hypothetical protein